MSFVPSPPFLLSSARKRNLRRQKAAAQHSCEFQGRCQSLEDRVAFLESIISYTRVKDVQSSQLHCNSFHSSQACVSAQSASGSFDESESTDLVDSSINEFYIGELMHDVEVQTDLTTVPQDTLAYASDLVVLLQALVHNANLDLQGDIMACEIRVATLLAAVEEIPTECCDGSFDDGYEVEEVEYNVAQDQRLCSLRLTKMQQQWESMVAAAHFEHAASQTDSDEVFSAYLHDAIELCEDIGGLMNSQHSHGIYTCGLAAEEVYMHSFGYREGYDAVVEHMLCLGIAQGATGPVLSLALHMLLNNRCDPGDYCLVGL